MPHPPRCRPRRRPRAHEATEMTCVPTGHEGGAPARPGPPPLYVVSRVRSGRPAGDSRLCSRHHRHTVGPRPAHRARAAERSAHGAAPHARWCGSVVAAAVVHGYTAACVCDPRRMHCETVAAHTHHHVGSTKAAKPAVPTQRAVCRRNPPGPRSQQSPARPRQPSRWRDGGDTRMRATHVRCGGQ